MEQIPRVWRILPNLERYHPVMARTIEGLRIARGEENHALAEMPGFLPKRVGSTSETEVLPGEMGEGEYPAGFMRRICPAAQKC